MTHSEDKVSDEPIPSLAVPLRRARWYGSLRILPDGRMRFSPWSYIDLPHVSLQVVTDGKITVRCANLGVMFLYLDRNRIESACFLFDLKPEHLRMAVAALRRARGGLDSWVIPALEMSYAQVKGRNPDAFNVIPELLASCRGLPVAPKWQRVRAEYFINYGVAPPVLAAMETLPATKPRRKKATTPSTTTPNKPRKASTGRGSQRG